MVCRMKPQWRYSLSSCGKTLVPDHALPIDEDDLRNVERVRWIILQERIDGLTRAKSRPDSSP